MTASMPTEQIKLQIAETIRRMLYPSPFMHWMEGLTNAERVGRIKRSKLSTLRYGLRQFVVSQISAQTDAYVDHKIKVEPDVDELVITGTNPLTPENNWEIVVPYPFWLRDFLEDDENFALMLPECEEKIGEVTQRIYEWCYAHPLYTLLVTPA